MAVVPREIGRLGELQTYYPLPPLLCERAGDSTGCGYGPASARAAVMKRCCSGWLDARNSLTRRVLRTTAAPILSSLTRIVAVQALASSVPCSARRRRLIINV